MVNSASTTRRESWSFVALWIMATFLMILWMPYAVQAQANEEDIHGDENEAATEEHGEQEGHEEEEEEAEPADAVLFPFFTIAVGIMSYWVLTRYVPWLPYTAACFSIGTIMGVCVLKTSADHLLHKSIMEWWIQIDSEVLLLIFLPGLVFKDASSLNVHLFQVSFVQCLLFAFPMVLAGTTLTALVGYHILPYDWSFNFCMTLGSILAATDPVAVSALLEAVGAPPRLKIHIAGESLLNDGAAIVFYNIFSSLYLTELEVPGVGEEIDGPAGVKLFFRKSCGAVAIGIFFGIGLLALSSAMNRRLNREENVVEVAITVAMAYLCYFTSEVAWETSGVIATLTMGVMYDAFGSATTNDKDLFEDFWSLVEYLLNTVLFTLGGLVWGSIIANEDHENHPGREFTGEDWGYLFVLFVMLTAIRFFLFIVFYPFVSQIGLKSSWQEMIFQAFGGLRGAVGISLALALDNVVRKATPATDSVFEEQTNKLFGYVGGIAFLTLLCNATVAGPFLKKLGLANATEIREIMVSKVKTHIRGNMVEDMVRLLSQERFHEVNFNIIKHHVPQLRDLTIDELCEAGMKYHEKFKTSADYKIPQLRRVASGLKSEKEQSLLEELTAKMERTMKQQEAGSGDQDMTRGLKKNSSASKLYVAQGIDKMSLMELRCLFIELLRSSYNHQIKNGELADREFVAFQLLNSLDFTADEAQSGLPLNDWEHSGKLEVSWFQGLRMLGDNPIIAPLVRMILGRKTHVVGRNYELTRVHVERVLGFIHAHKAAQHYLRENFVGLDNVGKHPVEKEIIDESNAEIAKAEASLENYPKDDVTDITSRKFATILLSNAAKFVVEMTDVGLMKGTEAEEIIEEIQEAILHMNLSPGGPNEGGKIREGEFQNE